MSIIFYALFIWLYKTGALLLSPWNRKARLWRAGRKGLMKEMQLTVNSWQLADRQLSNANCQLIWMHCASLGEFEQGRPLLESIRTLYPQSKIVLTFFSPSGYEIRKDYKGVDAVFYLPTDTASHASELLDILQPQLVLWVKYEYWHFYLTEISKRKIPLILVSGVFRDRQPFFKWYGSFHRDMLKAFTHFFVQDDDSKKLLGAIGYSANVTVSGDTRFDRVIAIAEQFKPISIVESFIQTSPVIVAGSTWDDDEEELDHFANTNRHIKFIIAPHEIDEEHLRDIEKLFHHTIRFSALEKAMTDGGWPLADESGQRPTANVLIVNNIGMLSKLYKYATITYVGGGFGDDGVHNVLEAAVYSKPVVFGPVYEKYREAIDLVDCGGGFSIGNALQLEKTLQVLLNDKSAYNAACEASGRYVTSNKGATEKIVSFIQENRLLTN